MSSDHCQRLLDSVTAWTDSLLALGWKSATARELDEAGRLANALSDCGLGLLAHQLQKLTTLLQQDEERDEAQIAECLGRLFIALEMTRESAQLQELATPRQAVTDAPHVSRSSIENESGSGHAVPKDGDLTFQ